jgi:hypothetical protein
MLKELASANFDLYIDQGDTYYKTFTVKDNSGAIVDLTGLTIETTMLRYFKTGRFYDLQATILNAVNGTIALSMTEMATRFLVENRYVYSVRLRDVNTAVKIMEGQVLVTNSAIGEVNVNAAMSGNQSNTTVG